jgi:dynein heavy chain
MAEDANTWFLNRLRRGGLPKPSSGESDPDKRHLWIHSSDQDRINQFFSESCKTGSTIVAYEAKQILKPGQIIISMNGLPEGVQFEGRAMFFSKTKDGRISDALDCTESVDFGTVASPLSGLANLLQKVYVPKICPDAPVAPQTGGISAPVASHTREFQASLQKFAALTEQTLQQTSGDVTLNVPDVIIDDPAAVTDDWNICSKLEVALEEWIKVISSTVGQETRKQPQGEGPLSEIEFWQSRNAVLSSLTEQLNGVSIVKMLKVLELVEASSLSSFNFHYSELTRLYIEAKDNVKFLATLERHFKNVQSGNLTTILDTLPSMMNSIRMVWIISRHYNTDERMVPLMGRIASEIARQVQKKIHVPQIFQMRPTESIEIIRLARTVLLEWEACYLRVRLRIEQDESGDHRWEFDRKRLFDVTSYMSKICNHLLEVATVLDQFGKFLGPELKAVTGDSDGIDQMTRRVEKLSEPLNSTSFDIFDREYKTSWDAIMTEFRESVATIEAMTSTFINSSFENLRSAEAAFDLLQRFRNIESRESINKQMMEKFDDILTRLDIELNAINDLFDDNYENPPKSKDGPPVAASIAWAQSLYRRAKRPIMRFKTMETSGSAWGNTKEIYLNIARKIDQYIQAKYSSWHDTVSDIAMKWLAKPVFGPTIRPSEAKNANIIPKPPYFVNFSPELVALVQEAKALDRMGFPVPESALNIALQEKKFSLFSQELNQVIKR